MSHGLTGQQNRLLEYLKSCGPVAPSFDEMKDHMGLKSKSGIFRIINALVERGYITKINNRARCVSVIDQPANLSNVPTDALYAEIGRRSLEISND